MEEVVGVVAQEDLVVAGDRFSGEHLPLAEFVADGGVPWGGDLLAHARYRARDRARARAELHEGLAIAAVEKPGVAKKINGGGGGGIENRANHPSRGSDAVAVAWVKGEFNGFIGFDLRIIRWIDRDGGAGGTRGETHRHDGGPGGSDTGVIDAAGGGAAQGVVNGQTVAGIACSGEGVDDVAVSIFCYRRGRHGECDHWAGHFEIKADRNG